MATQSVALGVTAAGVVGLWFAAHVGIGAKISEELQEQEELPPVASKGEIRREMLKEVLFGGIPILLAIVAGLCAAFVPSIREGWSGLMAQHVWLGGLLGSVLGGLVAAAGIWVTRVVATLALGRVAMGQGDTHLMLGIGSVLGVWPSILVFFLAPFAGLAMGIYKWMSKGAKELPYGPYLSMAAAVTILLYRNVAEYFSPHMAVIWDILRSRFGH
jgi:leader peptidase (prepilin peptidase)/N-methyltransferase